VLARRVLFERLPVTPRYTGLLAASGALAALAATAIGIFCSTTVEPFDECREMRRDGHQQCVVLIPQRFPNRVKPNVSFAAGIRVKREQRIARDDTSTNPIINSISCGGERMTILPLELRPSFAIPR
jgi:hypothetical protein